MDTMISTALFTGWEPVGNTVIVGVLAYIATVVIVRVSGKRTLASMSAFDFIVTVALGSIVASMVLSAEIPLAVGIAGLLVLVGLQAVVSRASVRSRTVEQAVKNRPRFLYYRGALLDDALAEERVSRADVMQALRLKGISSFDDVEAVVLESNGNFSMIGTVKSGERSTLADVAGGDDRARRVGP
jgi:uncharacterized membrane protein YcaP (DUF421 family)